LLGWLSPTTTDVIHMVEAKQSYRERMKAARAEARAKRQAEEVHRRSRAVHTLALCAAKRDAKVAIRHAGAKVGDYSQRDIIAMARQRIEEQPDHYAQLAVYALRKINAMIEAGKRRGKLQARR
jgi:hypothetical protein